MAYLATVTIKEFDIGGRRRVSVRVVETDAAAASEWSLTASATNTVTVNGKAQAIGRVYQLPYSGDIRDIMVQWVSGAGGATVMPRWGKVTAWVDGTLNEILVTSPTAAFHHITGPYPYNFHTVTPTMFGNSKCSGGAVNVVHTQFVIDEVR